MHEKLYTTKYYATLCAVHASGYEFKSKQSMIGVDNQQLCNNSKRKDCSMTPIYFFPHPHRRKQLESEKKLMKNICNEHSVSLSLLVHTYIMIELSKRRYESMEGHR